MNRRLSNVTLVAATFALATASIAAPNTADESPVISRGHKYCCWHDSGWNGVGWYRCGFANRAEHGWGGPEGWPALVREPLPGSGAWFERPPPTPPVGAPSIASERYIEPLRGGSAAGSPTGGSLRGQ
jgi:hypothetical protein